MSDLQTWEFDRPSEAILIHFDVDGHYIKLDTFIRTAASAQQIIAVIDQTFFQGQLEYEFVVFPPEDGSFLTKLGLWVGATVGSVFAFLNSDLGEAYIEALTGKSPAVWVAEMGESHRETFDYIVDNLDTEDDGTEIPQRTPDTELLEDVACQVAERVVVEMTRGILQAPSTTLLHLGMEIGALPDAMEARAEFYEACIEDEEIRRIGFDLSDDFPIPRSSFAERAVRPERKPKEDAPPEWVVSIERIFVTSPQWDEDDQKARQWKGKDSSRRDCYFVIDDAEFWLRVRNKELHVEVMDQLKVQWACQVIDGKPRNRRVLRVLSFNDEDLAKPLDADAVKAILGAYSNDEGSSNQPGLFDEHDPT